MRRRALVAILALFATGIFLLGRAGFAAGLSVIIVTTCVLGVITLGRNLGFVMIGLSALAHLVIGLLVSRKILHLAPREVDPLLFRNWIRMAATTSLLALLLAKVIEFVIRHVEANAAAARRMLGELRIAYERLGLLHGRLEAAKEEERRFLAHELHDELGQSLTALKLRLQLDGRAPVPRAPRGGAAGAGAHRSADRAGAADLHRPAAAAARRGRPRSGVALLPGGPGGAVERPDRPGVQGRHGRGRLAPDLEIACFRVVQESITNALRHASAHHIQVRIVRDTEHVSLAIRDDGRGFDPAALATLDLAAHLGIVGMRERVRARAGAFRLTSRPGAGTAVEIELPV